MLFNWLIKLNRTGSPLPIPILECIGEFLTAKWCAIDYGA